MLKLKNVTLLGLDCIDIDRLLVARDICVKDVEFGAVKMLTSLDSDDRDVIKIEKIGSLEEYSEFFIKKLNKYIDTDFVLVIQHDGFVLSAENWREEFLNYDYIGAPWLGYFKDEVEHNVGNGGFSLRSKKLHDILAQDDHIEIGAYEDNVICRQYRTYLEEKGCKFAPEEIAGKFAIPDVMRLKDVEFTDKCYRKYLEKQGVVIDSKEMEEKYFIPQAYKEGCLPWTGQFGFHYLNHRHMDEWLETHPEYKDRLKIEE